MYDSSTVQVHTPLISLFKKHGAFRPFERTKTIFKKKESVCAAPWYSSPKSQLGEHFASISRKMRKTEAQGVMGRTRQSHNTMCTAFEEERDAFA